MTFPLISSKNAKRHGINLAVLALSISLISCGGGGSDGYFGNTGGSSGTGTGTGTTPTQVPAVNISSLELFDVNNTLTRIVTVAGATAKVKVTDAAGKGISGALVTFSGESVIFGTTNGAVLTNEDGEASISVKPNDSNATGSYQLSAITNYNGTTATTSPYNFSLQAANIVLANVAAANTSLESGASTNITLKTQDATTNSNQNNVSVNFTTSCGTFDNATVVSSNQGDVTTTYKSIDANGKLCEGTQTIIATGTTASSAKSIQVSIAAIAPNSLVYTSGAVNLGIQKSGSASTGQVEFTLYANGTPAANKDVNIELIRGPEDLSIIALGNRNPKVVKSDSTGKINVTLYPGNKPGPVEVKATLVSNSSIFALSKNVAISTGRVTQSGLSLSVSKNALDNNMDGDTAIITARMVDRVGNPVPNGTVISFVTEGGSITPNCATTDGSCTVTLSTQDPRPVDNRVTVLAYVEGDKSYIDKNGDNLYTIGVDTLTNNIGDFFRDDNENNTYDTNLGEYIYRRGTSGSTCAPSTLFQPNIAGTCDNDLDAIIRQQLLFGFASRTPTWYGISGVDQAVTAITSNSFTFQVFGNSARTVSMPSGTTVAIAVKDNTDYQPTAKLVSDTTKSDGSKILNVSGARPNSTLTIKLGGTEYSVSINSSGIGSMSGIPSTETGNPEIVADPNQTCEAEIVQGDLTVPDVGNLSFPSVYKVQLKKCEKSDEIRITTTTPSGKISTRSAVYQ